MSTALRARVRPQLDSAVPLISNARLGIILLLAAESMLFSGLIGALLVFRFGSAAWPPPGMPRLPTTVTAINTAILFSSCVPMTRALRAIRRGDARGLKAGVGVATLLGLTFLLVQGEEWTRLIRYGLTIASGPYGATFYTLIGFHGLHVLAAVSWLGVILVLAMRNRFTSKRHTGVELATIYWYFVSGLWAVLFPLVYLGLQQN